MLNTALMFLRLQQAQSPAVQAAVAAAPTPTPPLDTTEEVPPLPPKGFYQPNPVCSTEELMREVLGSTINTITSIIICYCMWIIYFTTIPC